VRSLRIMPRVNFVNCWKPLRAMNTTTQMETSNVTVQKVHGLGNQPPSTVQVKVQRPGDIPHRVQANPKREAMYKSIEDMVFSAWKHVAVKRVGL